MSKYLVMVPVNLPSAVMPHRRFRVEVQYDGEITKEAADKIIKVAREYVESKKIEIVEGDKIEIYRTGK